MYIYVKEYRYFGITFETGEDAPDFTSVLPDFKIFLIDPRIIVLIAVFIELPRHYQAMGWLYAIFDRDRIVDVFSDDDRTYSSSDMLDDAKINSQQIIKLSELTAEQSKSSTSTP